MTTRDAALPLPLIGAIFAALYGARANGYFAPSNGPTPSVDEIARDLAAFADDVYLLACEAAGTAGAFRGCTDETMVQHMGKVRSAMCPAIHVWLERNGL